MRSIEDLAAEEDARIRRLRDDWLRKAFAGFLILLLAAAWTVFARGRTGWGSALAVLAILGLLARSGAFVLLPGGARAAFSAAMGAGAFLVYRGTAAPGFLDGRDPAFWLAALGGQVPEPAWSPLSYLLVGAVTVSRSPAAAASWVPELGAAIAALAVAFACLTRFFAAPPDRTGIRGFRLSALLAATAFILSRPLWSAATAASGIPATLGLLLFLWHERALGREGEAAEPARFLLMGLLFSAHPLWGVMGLLTALGSSGRIRWRHGAWWTWFFAGLTPYLWVLLRAGKVFPSWGGAQPFGALWSEGGRVLSSRLIHSGEVGPSLAAWGMPVVWLAAFVLLGILLASRDRPAALSRTTLSLLVLSFALGVLGYDGRSEVPSPVALWVPLLLAQLWVLRGQAASRRAVPAASFSALDWRILIPAGAVALALLPSQRVDRSDQDLARRHALNLLVSTGPRTAMVFEDPAEADACRLLQLTEAAARDTLFLDRRRLSDKRYLAGLIRHRPEWLFSSGNGSADSIFQDMVGSNLPDWDVRWAVSALPPDWDGILSLSGWMAHPLVLTQRLVASGEGEPPFEDLSARMDLSGWLAPPAEPGPAFLRQRERYTNGFMDLGHRMARLGRHATAIRSYERAARLDPDLEEPREALARLYTEGRVLEAARMEFTRIVKGHPARIEEWMRRAGEIRKGGDDPRVIEALDAILRLDGELSDAQYHLGLLLQREGKSEEAGKLFEAAAARAPRRVEVQMELGRQMLRVGNRVKAEEAFRAALGVDPQNKEAQRQLWRLLNRP
jgi:tetratricopeptide (TPR) repeat protein